MGFLSTVPSEQREEVTTTVYGSASARDGIPRFELGANELAPRTAARFIRDELQMDGTPALNLASFVTTYMEDEAVELMSENFSKNFIDLEEYPALGEIESRCVNIVARLFNAPLDDKTSEAIGVSTIGSSEAIILSVLAAKRRWKNWKLKKDPKADVSKPNIVMNAAVQVCWEKAARYLDVEERYWNCRDGQYTIVPSEVVDLVDENTCLVVSILGTTYTGAYEKTEELNDLLLKKNEKEGLDVGIHVDAASGGFVVPFLEKARAEQGKKPLVWDFRLPLVRSINASGHKYGLTFAGVGWNVWRSKEYLPDEILFKINYLGAEQVSFTLNFSKSAVQVIGQYYQFLRLGRAGFTAIMSNLMIVSDHLAAEISKLEVDGKKRFKILSETDGDGLPLVAWNLNDRSHYDEFAIARDLRQRGWIVPAYTMAPGASDLKLLRVVVREDFSLNRCEMFIRDLRHTLETLDSTPHEVLKATQKQKEETHKKTHKHRHHHKQHDVDDSHSLQGKHGKTHAIC